MKIIERRIFFPQILFGFLWLGFVVYAFTLSPPAQPDTLDLIIKLSSGQWEGINPLVVTLFNLMGVWPMIYACLALLDGPGQKIPAWPFVAFSFGLGAFALLPYLALREKNVEFKQGKDKLLNALDSPWMGRLLLAIALALVGYGLADGNLAANWTDFVQQWKSSQFIHVMSLDFCMLCAIVSPLLKDDMAKRDLVNPALYWTGVLIPLFGILIYLSLRHPCPDETTTSSAGKATQHSIETRA